MSRRKRKPKKGKKGEKAPTTTPGKVKRLVEWMIRHSDKKLDLPGDRLFHFFQTQILKVQRISVYLETWTHLLWPGMEHPSPLLLLSAVNPLVNVVPKALLIATIRVSTPNPIATQGGTAQERNTLTATIST